MRRAEVSSCSWGEIEGKGEGCVSPRQLLPWRTSACWAASEPRRAFADASANARALAMSAAKLRAGKTGRMDRQGVRIIPPTDLLSELRRHGEADALSRGAANGHGRAGVQRDERCERRRGGYARHHAKREWSCGEKCHFGSALSISFHSRPTHPTHPFSPSATTPVLVCDRAAAPTPRRSGG